jgi:threonine/homoserine/homoserine lactone efflux protein
MVGLAWLVGMIGFALAMAGTPGPNNTMAMASGASWGMLRSLPLMTGVAAGVAGIMLVVTLFGTSLVAAPGVEAVLKIAGAACLLWLAWRIATASPEVDIPQGSALREPPSFGEAALFQFVNPKLWIMVSGAVASFGQQARGVNPASLALILALTFGGVTFLCTLGWNALGSTMGRRLASRRSVRVFNYAMAGLLIASLIPVILE